MNAIVERSPGIARIAENPDRGRLAAKVLAASVNLQRTYIVVVEFREVHPQWKPSAHDPRKPISVELLRSGYRGERQRARSIIATTAPVEEIRALQVELKAFIETAPNPDQNRVLIGLMVDQYPQKAHAPEIYMAGLRHLADQGGYTPPMVARACALVVKASKFLPTPAEFVEALEKARWPGMAAREVERALELRQQADAALAEAERLGVST